MMVPRSFKYGAVPSPASKGFDEKEGRRKSSYNSIISSRVPAVPRSQTPVSPKSPSIERPSTQTRAVTDPMRPVSKPVDVPTRRKIASPATPSTRKSSVATLHRGDALPPSVAALLAITTIPPPRPHQVRRRRTTGTAQVSIDELVRQWKNDDSLQPGLASSPTMSLLLESDEDEGEEALAEEGAESRTPRTRSTSSESVPSLDADEQSLLSVRSPSTPASLRSRRSMSNLKREKVKSSSLVEDCLDDHPLSPAQEAHESWDFGPSLTQTRSDVSKGRSSLRSNLTTSLQALKNAAISSLSSLTVSSAASMSSGRTATGSSSPNLSDEVLWSHPFLFPRLSSEVRPTISGTPTKAQRRYLNPMPLTFEEQEEPFQRALHAPFLAEKVVEAPVIQLQSYSRGRRRASRGRVSSADSASEAGRAQLLSSGIRQREPRENCDFLRIVVLEMNMRRSGKIEAGRAKIWLPPRQVAEREAVVNRGGQVPARWVGICAS